MVCLPSHSPVRQRKRRTAKRGPADCRSSHFSSPHSLVSALTHLSNSRVNPRLRQAGLDPAVCGLCMHRAKGKRIMKMGSPLIRRILAQIPNIGNPGPRVNVLAVVFTLKLQSIAKAIAVFSHLTSPSLSCLSGRW